MSTHTTSASSHWGAVLSIALSVSCLITAEFLPVSLLTPIAADLGISQGMAGQSVSATALVAFIASLLTPKLTKNINKRTVILCFAIILCASSTIVALAGNFVTLIAGRLLLGVALGGFWALSASLAMRLVTEGNIPRALSIIFSGVSVAMVIAAPLGSFLGEIIGWRNVFHCTTVFGALCLIWQYKAVPSLPSVAHRAPSSILEVAKRPGVAIAMLAIFCVFAAQFTFFTYMRPFFQGVSGFDVDQFSTVLLGFGIANFLGTSLCSSVLRARLNQALMLAPLVMAGLAITLVILGHDQIPVAAATAVWGFIFGIVPVGWSTWITRNLGDQAESAGGLQVAVIQVANTTGAATGGLVLNLAGPQAPLYVAGSFFAGATVLALYLKRHSQFSDIQTSS